MPTNNNSTNNKLNNINNNNNNNNSGSGSEVLFHQTVKENALPMYKKVRPGEWVRPLGSMEAMSVIGGHLGMFNTVQAMWLSAPRPVEARQVKDAMAAVARRTGVLQLCVGRRALWPWFRRAEPHDLPFAVVDGDPLAAYSQALHEPYDMARGPLWRARLVVGPGAGAAQGAGPLDSEDEGEAGTEGAAWRGVLVVAVHHCVTDGLTNAVLCQDVLEALNGLATGGAASPPPPPPLRPVTQAVSDHLLGPADYLYALPYLVRKIIGRLVLSYDRRLYLDGALPRPSAPDSAPVTRVVQRGLTRAASRQLTARCRAAGVSVHSCVVAAANLALLRVAQSCAAPRAVPRASLNTTNCVNMRRYFPAALRGAAGCHIGLEEHEHEVDERHGASAAAFWGLAEALHVRLQHSLAEARMPLRNGPLFWPCSLMFWMNSVLARHGLPHRTDAHLVTTNMGDYRDVLPGVAARGGPVQAVHVLRSVAAPLAGHPFTLTFHTFRGRLLLALDYFTSKTTPEAAHALIHHLHHILHALATTGAPPPPTPPDTLIPTPTDEDRDTPSPILPPTPADTPSPTPTDEDRDTPSPILPPTPADTPSPTPTDEDRDTPSPILPPTPADTPSPTPTDEDRDTPSPIIPPTPADTPSPTPTDTDTDTDTPPDTGVSLPPPGTPTPTDRDAPSSIHTYTPPPTPTPTDVHTHTSRHAHAHTHRIEEEI
ncbi:uncharacterized protein LOC126992761 [Eriocheir sinensis]|uniref:uncharacterized protein LOC126992761 n=1 Tax=Eriocheir sinensis TaxID=95602 RepID=UPI0021C90EE4|nr:uncharacterized protein LOC126992761 [Eriocheir sinensis]